MIPTRFAHHCLGDPPWPPPVPRREPRFGLDSSCWLCGGGTDGIGWHRKDVLSATFTNHALARASWSQTVCQACVCMIKGAAWRAYVEAHPERGLIAVHPLGWHSFSHLFSPSSTVCGLRRSEIGAIMTAPPAPPFLLSLSESGKKHHIFRGAVATSRARFPVQMEETTIWVTHADYLACAAAARALFDLGASREAIETGRYHPVTLRALGTSRWRSLEDGVRPWRVREPALLHLALFTFTRPKEAADA